MKQNIKSYFDSIEKSCSIQDEVFENIDNISELIFQKINEKGRVIFISAGTHGTYMKDIFKTFEYLFKFPPNKLKVIVAASEYEHTHLNSWKDLENEKSVGSLAAAEIDIRPEDIVIGFSVSGKTNYVLYFLKESKDRGAFTSLITATRKKNWKSFANKNINIPLQEEPIHNLLIGHNTTIFKIIFESIIFQVFWKLGQIVNGHVLTTKIWTEKLKMTSIETIKHFKPSITQKEINDLIILSDGELSLILIMIKLNTSLKEAKKIIKKYNYNFNLIL